MLNGLSFCGDPDLGEGYLDDGDTWPPFPFKGDFVTLGLPLILLPSFLLT